MSGHRSLARRLPAALVFAALSLGVGPLSASEPLPVPLPAPTPAPPTDGPAPLPVPRTIGAVTFAEGANQDPHTRVYLVNGADPFGWAGMGKLAERIRLSGYPRTRYGEVYDIYAFEREVREVHRQDPAARFVLIGFSAGTLAVRMSANRLVRAGIPVAMVGYLGGDYLGDTPYTRPAGVGRVVNVTGNGFLLTGRNLFWNGTALAGATNVRLAADHFGLPTHAETLGLLLTGLAEVSAGR
jgi:hypothetical protein